MLLTITTTYQPASDLGYLLHKHPDRLQSFAQTFGQVHIFYPEVSQERCTMALLLDVDPVKLVRGPRNAASMEQYVNDRPYVASSFLSVSLADVLGTALAGHCKGHEELAATAIPLQATLSVVQCREGEKLLKELFEPLGYTVSAEAQPLDASYPEWGLSHNYVLTLSATCRLVELLTHLYVLIPVLDNGKHYWIGKDEVEKLLRRGKGWLEHHPLREKIAYRYLWHKPALARDALSRLLTLEADVLETGEEEVSETEERQAKRISLHEQRLDAVVEVLKQVHARSVLDLGCGEGRLLQKLLRESRFEKILGLDVSYRALELAQRRLHLDTQDLQRKRMQLLQGALTYRDRRLEGYDAAAVVEVIEHLDQPRLAAFERVLFEFARPGTVLITTPNVEYNTKFATLVTGHMRHKDHRFEWTRREFQDWAGPVAERYGYAVRFHPLGPEDEVVGAPSQMGIFSRVSTEVKL